MEKRECFCLQLRSFPPKYGDREHFLSCLYVLTHLIINGLGRQLALLQRFPGSVGPFPLSTSSCSTLPSNKKKSANKRPPLPLGLPVMAVTWPASLQGGAAPTHSSTPHQVAALSACTVATADALWSFHPSQACPVPQPPPPSHTR